MRDSSLKVRQLGRMPLVVCASPAYLERAGTPSHPRALTNHESILDSNMSETSVWRFNINQQEEAVQVNGRFRVNAPAGSARLAAAGAGIARCPSYTVAAAIESGDLVELFAENRVSPYIVAALFPQNRHLTTRVRTLIDHLVDDPELCPF